MTTYQEDISIICQALQSINTSWDGKKAILELKDLDYQWRQMEWIGWYFEVLCKSKLNEKGFEIPGKKYGNVEFDSFKSINWDMKASAVKSHSHRAILNDCQAIDQSIDEFGSHGIIMALLDVEYNDDNRSFQRWHSELKGGLSKFEKDRIKRNAISRYRKTCAELNEILVICIDANNVSKLNIHKQGRNSDGSPRKPKYEIDIEHAHGFEVGRISF